MNYEILLNHSFQITEKFNENEYFDSNYCFLNITKKFQLFSIS